MPYYRYLRGDRWGIYIDNQLAASIGCRDTCIAIVKVLETRMLDRERTQAKSFKTKESTAYFKSNKLVA